MKKIRGWWFAPQDNKLAHGDGRRIRVGITHKVKGDIVPCFRGLHVCPKILDALDHADSQIIYKVEGSGIIVPHGDPVTQYACSERTYLAGGIDISDILRKFARLWALNVIDFWNAPEIVVRYLKTGDQKIRSAAHAAAQEAAWVMGPGMVWPMTRKAAFAAAFAAIREDARTIAYAAARETASAAAQEAAREATRAAAQEAAREARRAVSREAARKIVWTRPRKLTRIVSWAAAREEAREAARTAAREAARDKQNKHLARMVNRAIRLGGQYGRSKRIRSDSSDEK